MSMLHSNLDPGIKLFEKTDTKVSILKKAFAKLIDHCTSGFSQVYPDNFFIQLAAVSKLTKPFKKIWCLIFRLYIQLKDQMLSPCIIDMCMMSPWIFITTFWSRQYDFNFVCHCRDWSSGPRPRSEHSKHDVLDRLAMDPLS